VNRAWRSESISRKLTRCIFHTQWNRKVERRCSCFRHFIRIFYTAFLAASQAKLTALAALDPGNYINFSRDCACDIPMIRFYSSFSKLEKERSIVEDVKLSKNECGNKFLCFRRHLTPISFSSRVVIKSVVTFLLGKFANTPAWTQLSKTQSRNFISNPHFSSLSLSLFFFFFFSSVYESIGGVRRIVGANLAMNAFFQRGQLREPSAELQRWMCLHAIAHTWSTVNLISENYYTVDAQRNVRLIPAPTNSVLPPSALQRVSFFPSRVFHGMSWMKTETRRNKSSAIPLY